MEVTAIPVPEWPLVLGAIGFGGRLGPILLLVGLMLTLAASASLLLNLEAMLTTLLAWIVFRENADRRVVLSIALIVAGGALLANRARFRQSGWLQAFKSSCCSGAGITSGCFSWRTYPVSRYRRSTATAGRGETDPAYPIAGLTTAHLFL